MPSSFNGLFPFALLCFRHWLLRFFCYLLVDLNASVVCEVVSELFGFSAVLFQMLLQSFPELVIIVFQLNHEAVALPPFVICPAVFFLHWFQARFFQYRRDSLLVAPVLLLVQCAFKLLAEVLSSDVFHYLVLIALAFQLADLDHVHQRGALLHGLLEVLLVELGELDPVLHRLLAEAGLLADLLRRVSQVHHHLESLRLFIYRQILPLHVLFQHRGDLRLVVQVFYHARQFNQSRSLRCFQAPVPDHYQVLACLRIRDHRQVLHNAVLLYAGRQLRQVAQVLPRVLRVVLQQPHRYHRDLIHSRHLRESSVPS